MLNRRHASDSPWRREVRDLLGCHAARFEQSENPCEVLRPADAQREDGQVLGPHDPQRHPFEVSRLGLLHGLAGESAEHGDELRRPGSDADGLALRAKTLACVELAQRIEPIGCRHCHQHVRIQRRHRLRVTHLRRGAEEGIVPDNACGAHLVQQARQLLHTPSLYDSRTLGMGDGARP